MKKVTKERRPSKYDELTVAATQDAAHLHSARIVSRRNVLNFEAMELEAEIVGLGAALARARERKKRIEAIVVGLGIALERRR